MPPYSLLTERDVRLDLCHLLLNGFDFRPEFFDGFRFQRRRRSIQELSVQGKPGNMQPESALLAFNISPTVHPHQPLHGHGPLPPAPGLRQPLPRPAASGPVTSSVTGLPSSASPFATPDSQIIMAPVPRHRSPVSHPPAPRLKRGVSETMA